jgi:hypothetical protein
MPTRDDLIVGNRSRRGNLPGLVVMYLVLVGTFVATALAIL